MPQASEIAWLIPVFPLIGAVFSGLGLICVNKKINNKYKGFTANLVREAFGWDDKFMKKQ